MFTETVETTWHAGHSLPHIPGRCSSLHGHTWRAALTIAGPSLGADGLLVDFGPLKARMNAWIDTHLDHALMLGNADNLVPLLEPSPDGTPSPLATAFAERGQRLFIFGRDFPDAAWPSVEGVAQLLAHHAHTWLTESTDRGDVYVSQVTVRETDNNSATWHNPDPVPARQAARAAASVLRRLLDEHSDHRALLEAELADILTNATRNQ
ncbi:6-carboxytetrahydropterin synthase [Planomonospora sp. ID82291]|uniref:6-pyruvoyl trahydropterin synthase family protein n=1 Tax=Planomonospora sp. ID82291 TaxID=2738136 RepID=UPI0018C44E1F|nr:6-carboxytetrahydropterin synthase [Planomonospora sp. ID82291]